MSSSADHAEFMNKLREHLKELDRNRHTLNQEIDEKIAKELPPEPTQDQIIEESPPLPELNTSKFRIERGNDEIAMWLTEGRKSGHLDETIIGLSLMEHNCPLSTDRFIHCLHHYDSFKDLFNHFRLDHYAEEDQLVERYAKAIFRKQTLDNAMVLAKQNRQELSYAAKKYYENLADNPSDSQLESHIKHVKNTELVRWINLGYAMLQECVIYEANIQPRKGRKTHAKYEKRAAACYRMQKIYGLLTNQISSIFLDEKHWKREAEMRRIITDGLWIEHGKKTENLPKWMQNTLSSSKDQQPTTQN